MALWEIKYPVRYTSDGDLTTDAIGKFIREHFNIYSHLNALRNFSVSDQPPLSPNNYDIWFKKSTAELLVYLEGSGWISMLKVKQSEQSVNSDKLGGYPASEYLNRADAGNIGNEISAVYTEITAESQRIKNYVNTLASGLLNSDSFVFKGRWVGNGGYVPYNVVEYLGSSYILTEGDGLVPPPAAAWKLVAAAANPDYMAHIDGGRAGTQQFAGIVGGGGAGTNYGG